MKRAFDIAVATLGAMTGVALAAVVLPSVAQPAAPASAASAPALTPNRDCGAGGTGLERGRVITRAAGESPTQKIDLDGMWQACKPCLPAHTQAFRDWTVGPNACTTALATDSDPSSPARDRTIAHGSRATWHQWLGPMRGMLVEACHDGTRRVVLATCAPVLACDTQFETTSDGGKTTYTYDARHPGKHVALGAYAYAESADGKRLRLQCVEGRFVKAPEPVPTAKPAAPAKPPVMCGPQSFNAPHGLTMWSWRYAGPRVDVGAVVEVERRGFTAAQDGGGVRREAVCTPTGQLKLGAN